MRLTILGLGALAALLSIPAPAQTVLFAQGRTRDFAKSLAPYVVSPQSVVDDMLELAALKTNETIYDLGSGDGRIVITAAQRYHAKAVGIELEESLVKKAEQRVESMGLQDRVHFIHADMRTVDLSPADVVTMYLMTVSNETLRPQLEKSLRPGARVVSHDYKIPGWKANREERTEAQSQRHVIYLYIMPPQK